MREKNDRTFTSFNPNSLYGLILGMRNDSNIIELVQIKQNGETKQEIPHGELTTIVVRIYEKILGEGIIEYSVEETKKNKAISKIIIPLIEKEHIIRASQKGSIHDYFRKKRIEARKIKGIVTVVTHKY